MRSPKRGAGWRYLQATPARGRLAPRRCPPGDLYLLQAQQGVGGGDWGPRKDGGRGTTTRRPQDLSESHGAFLLHAPGSSQGSFPAQQGWGIRLPILLRSPSRLFWVLSRDPSPHWGREPLGGAVRGCRASTALRASYFLTDVAGLGGCLHPDRETGGFPSRAQHLLVWCDLINLFPLLPEPRHGLVSSCSHHPADSSTGRAGHLRIGAP